LTPESPFKHISNGISSSAITASSAISNTKKSNYDQLDSNLIDSETTNLKHL